MQSYTLEEKTYGIVKGKTEPGGDKRWGRNEEDGGEKKPYLSCWGGRRGGEGEDER